MFWCFIFVFKFYPSPLVFHFTFFGVLVFETCNKTPLQVMAVRPHCQERHGLQGTYCQAIENKPFKDPRDKWSLNVSESPCILNFKGSCHVAGVWFSCKVCSFSPVSPVHVFNSGKVTWTGLQLDTRHWRPSLLLDQKPAIV